MICADCKLEIQPGQPFYSDGLSYARHSGIPTLCLSLVQEQLAETKARLAESVIDEQALAGRLAEIAAIAVNIPVGGQAIAGDVQQIILIARGQA